MLCTSMNSGMGYPSALCLLPLRPRMTRRASVGKCPRPGRVKAMTATPSLLAVTPASLRSALERLHLEGALFVRAEYTESWAYASPDSTMLAQALGHGPQRLIMFHIVA